MRRSLSLQVVSFTLIRLVLNTMHRMVYPFLPVFGRGLGVSLPALSAALTSRSLFGVLGPFLAALADSRGRKIGMLLGLGLFTFGALVVVVFPVFPGFMAALILTAAGKYIFDPSMQAYLGDRVAYGRRGRVLAITELGWSFSFILGIPLAGFLIRRYGWLGPFPTLLLLGVLMTIGLAWLLPKDGRDTHTDISVWLNIRSVLTYAPALAGLSVGFLISAANEVVNLVFGVWMESSFGLQITALGAASAVIGLSELGGEALSGGLTDHIGKVPAVVSGILLNGIAALALPYLGSSLAGATVGLFLFYITFEFTLVSSIPLMTEIQPRARATLMAANVAGLSLGRALGAALAPLLYDLGAGMLASGFAVLGFNALALLAVLWLSRTLHERV